MIKSAALGLRSKSDQMISVGSGKSPADLSRELPRIPTGGYDTLYDDVPIPTTKKKADMNQPNTEATSDQSP
jgi:hypothetical protein